MTSICKRWMASAVAASALAALSACGGGGDGGSGGGGGGGNAPATPVTANDDSATVPWNATTALSVTANDNLGDGVASINLATPPMHGSAAVSGTRIQYTPTPGYFGTDTLRYTVAVGNKVPSTASVQIVVAAHLTLSGTVHTAAMPGAQVQLSLDGTPLAGVTADGDGHYSIDFSTTVPSAFITLAATGAGGQSKVVLSSIVGDAGAAGAVAGGDGTVVASALPALNVSGITTAEAVLTAQALGKAPTSSADVLAARGQFTSAQTLQMAAAIQLVADASVQLPGGVADTQALVSDPVAYGSFITAQSTANATVFDAVQSALLADAAIAVAPPAPAAGTVDVTMVLTPGQGADAGHATTLLLNPDGAALVSGLPATWVVNGSEIDVAYFTPIVSTVVVAGSNGQQWHATETNFGFKLRRLGTDTAAQAIVASDTFLDGPQLGNTAAVPETWVDESIAVDAPAS